MLHPAFFCTDLLFVRWERVYNPLQTPLRTNRNALMLKSARHLILFYLFCIYSGGLAQPIESGLLSKSQKESPYSVGFGLGLGQGQGQGQG